MLISGRRQPRCQLYRTIAALSCHQNQHNSTKEHPWYWRWENNKLESWIWSTLEYKKRLWNEATKTYQSNKLLPSCFSSQYNICIPVAIQASKLPVLWGYREATPLLSHSSLGEFWDLRLAVRPTTSLWQFWVSLNHAAKTPLPRSIWCRNKTKTLPGLQKNKYIFNLECLWVSSKVSLGLVMTGSVERDEDSAFLFVWKTAAIYVSGGAELMQKLSWKRCRCGIISFDVRTLTLKDAMSHFFTCALMLSFPPNGSLLCDSNLYHAEVLLLLTTSQLENASPLTHMHEHFTPSNL